MRLIHSSHESYCCRRIIGSDRSSRNHADPPNWLAKMIDTEIARPRRWEKFFFFLRATDGCSLHSLRSLHYHVRSKVSVSFFLPSRRIQHLKCRTVGLGLWPETRAYVLPGARPRTYWSVLTSCGSACLVVTLHYLMAPQTIRERECGRASFSLRKSSVHALTHTHLPRSVQVAFDVTLLDAGGFIAIWITD